MCVYIYVRAHTHTHTHIYTYYMYCICTVYKLVVTGLTLNAEFQDLPYINQMYSFCLWTDILDKGKY